MHTIPLSSIEIRKRQRGVIKTADLTTLKEDIAKFGLLHPPVYWLNDSHHTDVWVLTAGERRTKAIIALHEEGREVRCGNTVIPKGYLPITRLDEKLDEIARFEAELSENTARIDLDWQERVKALADLHAMRQSQNPKQTLRETGKEMADRGLLGGVQNEKRAEQEASQAVVIAQHLDNPAVAQARNAAEVVGLIYKQEEEKLKAALIRRRLAVAPQGTDIDIRQGDSLSILPSLDANICDLILADPPYGLGAGESGFRQRTVHHHNYEDTPTVARQIAQSILTEGFRICKPRANIFMFCDIALFDWLKMTAANMGWVPFPRPLIWVKSQSEGLAPWGGSGPRITTEFILYATKGQRGLHASPTDVFQVNRVPRKERLHAAEKPVELLARLISCSTLPGDLVLDPCCGSGSALVAAKDLKRRGIGIEKDPAYHNTAMANVFGGDLEAKTPTATTEDLEV